MSSRTFFRASLLALIAATASCPADDEGGRIAPLDAYWAEVSRAVKEGDFKAYVATCHDDAVLVTGSKKSSYPLAQALARWKGEFDDTREGTRTSSVRFRFAHRFGDATTAHESGIFLYAFRQGDEELKEEFVHFEALLVKKPDGWKILMEYQKGPATEAEWKALK